MPFKNKAQMRACFSKYNQDIKAGRIPAWDCYKWIKETPGYSTPKRSPTRNFGYKIYIGSRGGKYAIVNGKKIYI